MLSIWYLQENLLLIYYVTPSPFLSGKIQYILFFDMFQFMGSNPTRIVLDLQYLTIMMRIEGIWIFENLNFYWVFSPLLALFTVAVIYFVYILLHFLLGSDMKKSGRRKAFLGKVMCFYFSLILFYLIGVYFFLNFCEFLEGNQKKANIMNFISLLVMAMLGLTYSVLVMIWHRGIRLM